MQPEQSPIRLICAAVLSVLLACLPLASLAMVDPGSEVDTGAPVADLPCHSHGELPLQAEECSHCDGPGIACDCCHIAVSASLPAPQLLPGMPFLIRVEKSVRPLRESPEPPVFKQFRPPRTSLS